VKTFIAQRWHGLVGWRTLFWRDLLIVSSIWSAPQRPKIVLGASVFWLVLFVAV
jgi:hypothetical protein